MTTKQADSTEGKIITTIEDQIMTICVDRQAKRNAFTPQMIVDLSKAFTRLEEDPDIWVGVVTFAGAHSTGGLDLPKFGESLKTGKPLVEGNNVDPFGVQRRCTKPLVCAVQGFTFTAGIELMLACDIVIAAEDCVFSQMEPKRGIMAFGGASFRMVQRAGWGNAMVHLLVADKFDAQTALRHGLVQEVVPAGQQKERAREIAELIRANAPLAVQATKIAAQKYVEEGEAANIATYSPLTTKLAASKDAVEGVTAMKQKRAPVFKGE